MYYQLPMRSDNIVLNCIYKNIQIFAQTSQFVKSQIMHCGGGNSLGSSWPHIPNGDYTCPARKMNAANQSDKITEKDNAINVNVVPVVINCLVIDTQAKQFLLGKQKRLNGDGSYALPGGHLKVGDSWMECAKRELKDETGLENVHNWELTYITNDVLKNEGKHSLTLFMRGEIEGDTKTKLRNPDKWERWKWISFDSEWDAKQPTVLSLQILHEAYQTFKWNPFITANKTNLMSAYFLSNTESEQNREKITS